MRGYAIKNTMLSLEAEGTFAVRPATADEMDRFTGGVDTQKQFGDGVRTLSARYILEGEDYTGKHCHIFIENNGSFQDGTIKIKPMIFTDSKALSWMMTADMIGTVTGAPNGVRIAFFQAD